MILKRRRAVSRHSFLGKILSGLILAGFILYVLPRIKPSLFSLFVVAVSIGLIADVMARFFSGKNDWKILIAAGFVVLADILFFVVVPESPI